MRHNGLTAEPRPTVFLAQSQVPGYFTYIVVRTAMEPKQMAAAIRQSGPSGAFASLALLLAAVGLYGVDARSKIGCVEGGHSQSPGR
jgi:hypothetical protein